jgi:dUTPase
MIRPVPCRVGFCPIIKGTMMIQRLDHDYSEDTDTEQIEGVHNLIRGLMQYADTDTVIGYGDRICQMIISGPALKQ